MLSPEELEQFHTQGFLFLKDALTATQLKRLTEQFDLWKEQSRSQTAAYGETIDGRPRFDIEPGHCAERPALRRIASPVEISDVYLEVMRDNRALDAVVDIFGPNIKFENAKINSKLPGAATQVKFHQDFLFEAHTNDDMITVLFFLDDVTPENGPLQVIPGTHKGRLYDHWHDGIFTGAVSDEVMEAMTPLVESCFGPAGSACLMHTRLLHGSGPNLSKGSRTLFICEYLAEDSYPLHDNHIPSKYQYEVVRGEPTGRVRCSEYEMAFPEMPTGASFFEQQAKKQ